MIRTILAFREKVNKAIPPKYLKLIEWVLIGSASIFIFYEVFIGQPNRRAERQAALSDSDKLKVCKGVVTRWYRTKHAPYKLDYTFMFNHEEYQGSSSVPSESMYLYDIGSPCDVVFNTDKPYFSYVIDPWDVKFYKQ